MNLQQLKYFTTLAEEGHFGRAAEKLHITQPALSNSIKGLERELGSDLFERTGRKVVLTPYGTRFIPHIVKALGEIDRAVSLSPSPRADRPTIRISTVASIQQTFLPPLLIDYVEENQRAKTLQEISFDILEAHTTFNCTQLLHEGKIDVAFCGHLPSSGFSWIPVMPQNLVAAVNPHHPLAEYKTISLNDLLDYPLISYRRSSMMYSPVKAITDSLRVHFQESFNDEAGAPPGIISNPQCVALLLDTVEGNLRTRIRYIPIEELQEPFHMVGLAYKRASLKSEAVAHFVEYIESRFAGAATAIATETLLDIDYTKMMDDGVQN